MFVKTVSKYTVSLENINEPVLAENSKSLRQELQNSKTIKQIRKDNNRFIRDKYNLA